MGWHVPKLPGLGEVRWGDFFAALTDTGYNGPVCIEVEDRAYEGSLADRKRACARAASSWNNSSVDPEAACGVAPFGGNPMLKEGDKVMVAHRRLFHGDMAHYFIGRVDAYEAGLVKLTGHSFIRDLVTGRMIEKMEPRTKILSLSSGMLLIYLLPDQTALETVTFNWEEGRLVVTDGKGFTMNLGEVTHRGQV